jgi:hypothetical protein
VREPRKIDPLGSTIDFEATFAVLSKAYGRRVALWPPTALLSDD